MDKDSGGSRGDNMFLFGMVGLGVLLVLVFFIFAGILG